MPRTAPSSSRCTVSVLSAAFALLASPMAAAESGHTWMHRASPHFVVTYDQSTAPLVDRSIQIAEATATRLGGLFGWKFDGDRLAILLTDDDDNSNGMSLGRIGLVQIQCRKVPMEWRDETRWLETVLSHELSHVYTLAQMQRPVTMSFGISDHSDAGLKEFEYGTVGGMDEIPRWFVEGMAQIGSEQFGADGRDPLREVLLGDAYRNRRLLSWQEMARFEGTSREYELVYNQGFDLLLFLRKSYPNVGFSGLCNTLEYNGFQDGFRKAYGKPLSGLYADWLESLAARFPQVARDSAGYRLFKRDKGALLTETGASGRWAVANWNHDYLRYDLFEIPSKGDPVRRESDVAEKVVSDAATGSVWYASSFRNTDKGSDQFDLFRRDRNGRATRETNGARAMVFDAKGDQLVYARYEKGVSTVVRRVVSTRQETVLHAFPYDTAVHEIAIHSPDSVFLDLGTGDARRAALVDGKGVRVLWSGRASVRSIAPWTNDTLVFVAVDSGVPRLMWSVGEGEWHRLPSRRPVRSVWVDRGATQPRLLASVYENGGRRVRVLDGNWASGAVVAEQEPVRSPAPWAFSNAGQANGSAVACPVIRMPIHFAFGHSTTRRSDSAGNFGDSHWYAMVSEELADPSLKRGIGFAGGGGFFPSGKRLSSYLPVFSAWGWFGEGDLSTRMAYTYQTSESSYEDSGMYVVYKFTTHSFDASVGWAFSSQWAASVQGSYFWQDVFLTSGRIDGSSSSQTGDVGTVLRGKRAKATLVYGAGDSRMDPAELGSPGGNFWLHGSAGTGQRHYLYAWRPQLTILSGQTGVRKCIWVPGDVASLTGSADVYGVAGGIDSALSPLPGAAVSMGGSGPFRGYADDDLHLRAWARGTAELRVSPFASRKTKISWSDRLRVAARLEGGYAQYLSKSSGYDKNGGFAKQWLEKTTPVASWDISIRQGFYLSSPGQSWLEIGFAQPLNRLDFARRNDPYRFFFELQLR